MHYVKAASDRVLQIMLSWQIVADKIAPDSKPFGFVKSCPEFNLVTKSFKTNFSWAKARWCRD